MSVSGPQPKEIHFYDHVKQEKPQVPKWRRVINLNKWIQQFIDNQVIVNWLPV